MNWYEVPVTTRSLGKETHGALLVKARNEEKAGIVVGNGLGNVKNEPTFRISGSVKRIDLLLKVIDSL